MTVRNAITSLFTSVLLTAAAASAQSVERLAPPGDRVSGARPGSATAILSAVIMHGGKPSPDALVRVENSTQFGWTDASGSITLDHLQPGNQVLLISTGLWSAAVPVSLSSESRGRGVVPVNTQAPTTSPMSPTEGRGHDGAELEGSISAIDLTASTVTVTTHEHGVVTVAVNASTLIRHGSTAIPLAALTLGLQVHVRASVQADLSVLALEINVEADMPGPSTGAFVHGTITAIDTTATSFTLHTHDGDIIIVADTSTTFLKNGSAATLADLAVGDSAQVGGTLQADGSILAAKVLAETPEVEGVEAEGMITAIDTTATSFTLHTHNGDIIIVADTSTTFKKNGSAATFADLAVGDAAQVGGTLQTDGSILAAKVSAETPKIEEAGAEGTISAIDATTTSFTLHTHDGDIIIVTDTSTIFKKNGSAATFADLAVGDAAEAEGTLQTDGSILAKHVSFEPPEPVEVEVSGTVTSVDPGTSSFVVQTSIGPITIDTNSETSFRSGHDSASFDAITVGANVKVTGALQSDGSVMATRVSIEHGD